MDKYEYNLKLDQIKSLSSEENYVGAAEIADTINWNKIKNINTLVKAGEIYEKQNDMMMQEIYFLWHMTDLQLEE